MSQVEGQDFVNEGVFTQRQANPYPMEKSIGGTMSQILRLLNPLLELRVQKYGISQGTWFFVRSLWDEDGISQRELSDRVGTSAPTTLAAVRALKAGGFVKLKNDPNDRRRTVVFLTAKGKALQHSLIPEVAGINPMVLKGFSNAEVGNLLNMLQRLRRNAEEAYAAERRSVEGELAA